MFTREQYMDRLNELKAECGLDSNDLEKIIVEKLAQNGFDKPEDNALHRWARGYRSMPPIGILAIMAKKFECSVGYLVGQHNVHSLTIDTVVPSVDFSAIRKDYKEDTNNSIFKNSAINSTWVKSRQENTDMLSHTVPFYKLADLTGYSIDYLLGFSRIKHWQAYAADNGMFEFFDSGSLMRFTGKDDPDTVIYGFLSADKKSVTLNVGGIDTIKNMKENFNIEMVANCMVWE